MRSAVEAGLWIATQTAGLWHVSQSGEAQLYGGVEIGLQNQSRDGAIWAMSPGLGGRLAFEGDRWIALIRQ